MGEDTSKSKGDLTDSEKFDIAVRRDDTKSLDDIVEKSEHNDESELAPEEASAFEEKEETRPEDTEQLDEQPAVTEPVPEMKPVETIEEPAAPVVAIQPEPQQSAPVVAPQPAVVEGIATEVHEHRANSPGALVLQWLSYAFWGWFGTALAVLASITFGYFIAGSDATFWGDNLAYPLAAVIVMLVIALATDFFYARHEPVHKRGAASVIMLIHVVLYMLTVVGALIGIVFGVIRMLITADPVNSMDGTKVFMLTALVAAVVFGAISFRSLFAGKKRGVRKAFWLLMSILALGFVVVSIAGPAMKANSTKNDRLIETALPSLASDIREYTRENDKLPASLSQVKSSFSDVPNEQVQMMVDRNLVTYKPNSKPAKTDPLYSAQSSKTQPTKSQSGVQITTPEKGLKTFYYQLCVTYKEAKNSKYYRSSDRENDYTSSYVSTYTHPKGEVCYSISAQGKYPQASY